MALAGESVFFTGSAGTGKSVVLRAIIKELRLRNAYNSVAVTASTGIAAMNIGGTTLHSFAGVGIGNEHAYRLIHKAQGPRTAQRWRNTDILIIDEVSMIEARWFDVLNEIGKLIRENDDPFGGIQLVICGDFFQLPPVPPQSYADARVPASFAFEAQCWNEAVPNTIKLTKVFRQKQPELIKLLNDMRVGVVSEASEKLLYNLARNIEYADGIEPTEIFPLRRLADAANKRRMDILDSKSEVFYSTDELGLDIYGKPITHQRGMLLLDKMIAPEIELKVGAQVMCLQNFRDSGIANGSVGIITRFAKPGEARNLEFVIPIPNIDPDWRPGENVIDPKLSLWEEMRWPVVKYQNGVTVLMGPHCFTHQNAEGGVEASRYQVPLSLAWALTVHKAQGQTLARVKVDLEGTFEKGQAYVALSRCTTLEGLQVQGFSPAVVFTHPRVVEWARNLEAVPGEPLTTGEE